MAALPLISFLLCRDLVGPQGPTNMLVVRGNWPRELPTVRALPLLDGPRSRVTAMCLTPLGGNDRLLVRI